MGVVREEIEQETGLLAAEAAERLGLEVVEVTFRRQGKYTLLRVDVDRPGATGVTLEECERISRDLEAALDRAEMIEGRYDLQVSSPGVDRPIRTEDDVRRNTGRRVVIETTEPVDGQRSFHGVLRGLDDECWTLAVGEENEVRIPRTRVAHARQELGLSAASGGGGRTDRQRKRRGIV